MELINIETGEILNEDCDDVTLAQAYKSLKVEMKRLEDIEKQFRESVLDRLSEGQKTFGDYFEIRYTNRRYMDISSLPGDVSKLYKDLKRDTKYIESEFGQVRVEPQIWFPRLG